MHQVMSMTSSPSFTSASLLDMTLDKVMSRSSSSDVKLNAGVTDETEDAEAKEVIPSRCNNRIFMLNLVAVNVAE